jgi:hypothetical protein
VYGIRVSVHNDARVENDNPYAASEMIVSFFHFFHPLVAAIIIEDGNSGMPSLV